MKKSFRATFIVHIILFAATIVVWALCYIKGSKGILSETVMIIIWSVLFSFSIVATITFWNKLDKNKYIMDKLFTIIPGGAIECFLDEGLPIKEFSPELLDFLGYGSVSEFRDATDGKMINLVVDSDRQKVRDAYFKQTGYRNNNKQVQYKMICQNGREVPVVAIVSYRRKLTSKLKKQVVVHSYLADTMSFKQFDMERDIDSERYRIVAEQSDSIIYDYDIERSTVYLNSNFEKKFGYKLDPNENLLDLIREKQLIHPDDEELFFNIQYKPIPKYNEIEVRLKKKDGSFIWCKIRMSAIIDKVKQKNIRIIGKIIDVNTSRTEKIQLIEKTKRDIMTDLYNKTTTEALISKELEKADSNSLFAFILFDIDNFKQINDVFGHLRGDEVLSAMAVEIKSIFRSSDILGRVGGDEFVIFIKDLPSEEHAIKKANHVLSIINNKFNMKTDGFVVTASFGISFYNKDGKTFSELFEKADTALYVSKGEGKNAINVYHPTFRDKSKNNPFLKK